MLFKKPQQPLPNDPDLLKEIILKLNSKIFSLEERISLLLLQKFGKRSEKYFVDPRQRSIFNEAEAEIANSEELNSLKEEDKEIDVGPHKRKVSGRKPLPPELPRVDIIKDLSEEEKICSHDGHQLKKIGEEISEQLDIIPAKVSVNRYIRYKYACPHCEQSVKTAPVEALPIPKSIASPGLLAHIAVCKYEDSLPLYRQENILKRSGVDLPRSTLSRWMIKIGELVTPVINLIREDLLEGKYIQMDETIVQVLKEKGKTAESKSYMWVQNRPATEGKPIVLFNYRPNRGAENPKELLFEFKGFLQTDAYSGYNSFNKQQDIIHVGCLAHARRKFFDAMKEAKRLTKNDGKSGEALIFIRKLYAIEDKVRGLSFDEIKKTRENCSKPILAEFKEWWTKLLPQAPPGTLLGKALYYVNEQWEKLTAYLQDGRLHIDNNLCENKIRPFAIGRKNWLFCDTQDGAHASANIYSLIQTAKANNLDPYLYMCRLLIHLPKAQTVEQFEALLPWNLTPEKIKI